VGDGWGRERVAARASLRVNMSSALRGRGSDVTERVRVLGASPRRRLIAVAAIGLVAVGVLAGCRSEPGTAAFVGGTRITDQQVKAQLDSLTADLQRSQQQGVASQSPDQSAPAFDRQVALKTYCGGEASCRTSVLEQLVAIDVIKRYLADHKSDTRFSTDGDPVGDAQKAIAQAAATNKVAPSDLYLNSVLQFQAYEKQLASNLTPVTPTQADLMAIYQQVKDAGLTTASFADVKAQIAQLQGLGQGLAVKKLLAGAGQTYNVSVNPRYVPTQVAGLTNSGFQLPTVQVTDQQGRAYTIVGVRLGTNDVVVGTPSARSSASAPAP
jgi:hypothetical protein